MRILIDIWEIVGPRNSPRCYPVQIISRPRSILIDASHYVPATYTNHSLGPVLFKTAVKRTIKVGGPSAAEGAPRGSPVASKTRGGELVIKPRRALATTTSGAMRFLEHGIKSVHSYAATCHQINCRGLAQDINFEKFNFNIDKCVLLLYKEKAKTVEYKFGGVKCNLFTYFEKHFNS